MMRLNGGTTRPPNHTGRRRRRGGAALIGMVRMPDLDRTARARLAAVLHRNGYRLCVSMAPGTAGAGETSALVLHARQPLFGLGLPLTTLRDTLVVVTGSGMLAFVVPPNGGQSAIWTPVQEHMRDVLRGAEHRDRPAYLRHDGRGREAFGPVLQRFACPSPVASSAHRAAEAVNCFHPASAALAAEAGLQVLHFLADAEPLPTMASVVAAAVG
jgi:hypothetical protein